MLQKTRSQRIDDLDSLNPGELRECLFDGRFLGDVVIAQQDDIVSQASLC